MEGRRLSAHHVGFTVTIAAMIVGLFLLAAPSSTLGTTVTNVFSGQWTTSGGSAGSVTFKVVTDAVGAPGVEGLGGHACGAPTTYYRGDYSDQANPKA